MIRVLTLLVLCGLSLNGRAAVESSVVESGYRSGESPIHFAVDFQYTGFRWMGLAADRQVGGLTYGEIGKGGRLAFEYIPVKSIGRIGIGVGITLYGEPNIALGNERYTSVIGVPVDLSLSYRAAFTPRQWVVPFLKGGIGAVGVKYTSKTGGPDQLTQIEATLQYGGGLEFCLSRLELTNSHKLDSSMGINAIYLVTEYSRGKMLGANPLDLSYESYQAGMRFEF
jgi:opacity protein-like surface antigen